MSAPRLPGGARAIMASRREPPDSLDYFPTPPWATRAFLRHGLLRMEPQPLDTLTVWEPACGEGHMAAVLGEAFGRVIATDVFDYGYGGVRDFLAGAMEPAPAPRCDWIITNPPFNAAERFLDVALATATRGVALLLRNSFGEGENRYQRIYSQRPPTDHFISAERISMSRGRWEPGASYATAYSWFVWFKPAIGRHVYCRTWWIPPGQRKALTTAEDIARFAWRPDMPIMGGA